MTLYDQELAEIVREGTPVEINGSQYIVESNKSGSCDGCVFLDKNKCPHRAVTYCTSNGGNILKLYQPNNK